MKLIRNLDKTAIICDDKPIGYRQLLQNINFYTGLLDIEKGERVSVFSANRLEYFYLFFATWNRHGIVNPLDYNSNVDELAYYLGDSSPKYIFTSSEGEEKVRKAVEKSQADTKVIVFENIDYTNMSEEIREVEAPPRDDVTVILYTSGTTGDPKGVMLTFDNFLSQIESIGLYNIYEPQDKIFTLLPLHHIFPMVVSMIMPLYFGSTTVFLTDLASDKIKKTLVDHQVTILIGVPKLYEVFHKGIMKKIHKNHLTETVFKLAKNIKQDSIRKLLFKKVQDAFGGHMKYLVSGGAKLDEKISTDFQTMGFQVLEGYGMTETAPIITFTKPHHFKAGSAGSPLESIRVKTADDGEILVKGRNVMKGYYNKPEKTKEMFDDQGWLHTGDLGYFDEENYIHVTGRKKEMIVLPNGKNIDPFTIEHQIMDIAHGFIQEIAIVDYHEHLNALILPDYENIDSKDMAEVKKIIKKAVIDNYNSHSLSYKKVINFKIVEKELPRTRLGKLKRFMLKDMIA